MSEAIEPSAPAPAPVGQPAPHFRSDLERNEHRDNQDRESARLGLSDWLDSGEYHSNVRLINGHLDRMPEAERAKYDGAVLENGTLALNDPATLRQLAADARTLPAGFAETANQKHGGNVLEAIEAMMGSRNGAYWKGPDAERYQTVYRDLITERESVKERLEAHYAKNPRDYEQALQAIRENWDAPGFEKQSIETLISHGRTATEAHAIAAYFKARVQRAR